MKFPKPRQKAYSIEEMYEISNQPKQTSESVVVDYFYRKVSALPVITLSDVETKVNDYISRMADAGMDIYGCYTRSYLYAACDLIYMDKTVTNLPTQIPHARDHSELTRSDPEIKMGDIVKVKPGSRLWIEMTNPESGGWTEKEVGTREYVVHESETDPESVHYGTLEVEYVGGTNPAHGLEGYIVDDENQFVIVKRADENRSRAFSYQKEIK